ncbi:MAG TPA: hypothetical protein VGC54_01165 [Planctomycetota bacterium]
MTRVENFPDLLPLRGADGAVTGLFGDHGAWFGLTWGRQSLFDVHDQLRERVHAFHVGAVARQRRVWADRLEAELENGARVRAGFASADALVVEYRHHEPPEPGSDLPFLVVAAEPGRWFVVLAPRGGGVRDPDCFERNRARWNEVFARAFAGRRRAGEPLAELLLARAVTTLGWNRRAAIADLRHAGVVPSPFSYRGYWGWDSWKHAHALARYAPELAAEQLRVQFSRQRSDGMVPDTVMPRAERDNWNNSKPPLAAWALREIWTHTGDDALLAELYPACARQLLWWGAQRRFAGEALARCGGRDHRTATWDGGWDDSLRYAGVKQRDAGEGWRLFELWQPDLNGWIFAEARALADLAPRVGADPEPWAAGARALGADVAAHLWSEARGWFVDAAPPGESPGYSARESIAGVVPAWAGAASREQIGRVRAGLLDERRFATPMPFPSLAAAAPGFDGDGYWNGAVWLDHAAIALHVLGEDGAELEDRLFRALAAAGPLHECYHPLESRPCAGARQAVPQFSWTAAAIVELLHGGPRPGPGD